MEQPLVQEAYVAALWEEIGAWNDLLTGLRDQRAAIVRRDVEAVWASQERLQEGLRQVAVKHEARRRRPRAVSAELASLERQTAALHEQTRAALALNFELLRDICCYLDMLREVAFPETLAPTYHRSSGSAPATAGLAVSRTA